MAGVTMPDAWSYDNLFKIPSVSPLTEIDLGGVAWPPVGFHDPKPPNIEAVQQRLDLISAHYLGAVDITTPSACLRPEEVLPTIEAQADRLAALFSSIRRSPYNARLMQEAACILQTLATKGGTEEQTEKTLAQGGNGAVMRGLLPARYGPLIFPADQPPPFILKTSHDRGGDVELITESAVGLYGTNSLRAEIPNFMYVYGAYRCGRAKFSDEEVTTCSEGAKDQGLYVMVETISDAMTLDAWARTNRNFADFVPQVNTLLLQVLLSLAVARGQLGFTHGDLSAANVMVRQLPAPRTIRYRFQDGTSYYVVSDKVATLIDFGRSHLRVPFNPARLKAIAPIRAKNFQTDATRLRLLFDDNTFQTGLAFPTIGQMPWLPNSLYDVFHVVNSTAWVLPAVNAYPLWTWLRPLCRSDASFQRAFDRYKEWRYDPYYDTMPFGKDISVRALVEAALPLFSPDEAPAVYTYHRADLPPMFSCEGPQGCLASPVRGVSVTPPRRRR